MNREQIVSLYDECKLREQKYKDTNNEIVSFSNYFYKSLKAQLLKGNNPSFFVSENNKLKIDKMLQKVDTYKDYEKVKNQAKNEMIKNNKSSGIDWYNER